jgi:hypothetical protein
MRAVYGHVSPAMRAELKEALQRRWQQSLHDRACLAPRSSVRSLDALLTQIRPADSKIGSRLAPKIGHRERRRITDDHKATL